MSVASGPYISTTGLSFMYDMGDINSWRGAPYTNQYSIPVPSANGDVTFAVQGNGTFRRIYEGTYGNYSITNNDVVYRYDLGGTGCHYHGNSVAIPAGVYPTFTFDYYISPDAANFPTTDYLANFENYGGGAQGGGTGLPNTLKGVWQTVKISGGLTASSGTQAMFLYPGGCGSSYLASSGYILYKNPQVLFTTTSGFSAPFTGPYGARSNTQALLDLTNNGVITTNNLTYNTDNTFSFNGSSNYMSYTPNSAFNMYCLSVWYYNNNAIPNNDTPIGGPSTYQTMVMFNNAYPCGVNLGAWTSSMTNEAIHIWTGTASAYAATYNRDYVAVGWHNTVFNWNGTTYDIWTDGVKTTTYTMSGGATLQNISSLQIGYSSPGYYFNGNLPSFLCYSTQQTDAQVVQNFNAQRTRYGI